MAGGLITQAANKYSSTLLPVDSEPSAIWQCLQGENRNIDRLLITASGGALRRRPITSLASVTPEEALQHPTWEMGKKITIDSATLMNKAFEVIECHWLFDVPWDRIQVVIHPQSIIHSMVEFSDGSVKAQISPPDMRLPIQYALLYPQRKPNESFKHFDPVSTGALTFEPMDIKRYPCFSLALSAAKHGGTYPAVLSAADEIAVRRFLENQYGFLGIYAVVEQVLAKHDSVENPTIEEILTADAWARRQAEQVVVK
jgi:1-deoxy-D-xylulose-5-phosphate reductoisomerase